MKFSRPLFFILTFSLIISFFVIPVSAATNLINPNLNEWDNITSSMPNDPSVEGSLKMSVHTIPSSVGNIYRLQPTSIGVIGDSPPAKFFYGHMFDKTVLKAGNSYTFQMHILSPSEIRRYTSYTWDDSGFTVRLGHGYIIGFGVVDFNGEVTYIQEFVAITPDNYSSLAGKDFVQSFECPSYSGGNPCIFIMSSWVDAESTFFFDDSMVLIDNAEEDEEGFLAGLFEWFEKKFNAIGVSFDNLGSNVTSGLNNLGERIKGFFNDLSEGFENAINGLLAGIGGEFQKFGNLFLYFTYSDVVPENPFEAVGGPLDLVEGYFDDMIEYLRNVRHNLTDVVDSVSAGTYLFDVFTDRFPWVKSLCVFALAMIVISRFIGL